MIKKFFLGLVVCLSMFAVVLCAGEASAIAEMPPPTSCNTNADCGDTDGLYCTVPSCTVGVSTCEEISRVCTGGTPVCDETGNQCVECLTDGNCGGGTPFCVNKVCEACVLDEDCLDDGKFCTGDEVCVNNVCGESGNPCVATDQLCNETGDECYDPPECAVDADCSEDDDGLFCNGPTICTVDSKCNNAGSPCEGATPECIEQGDGTCVECLTDGDCDGDFPFCVGNVCVACEENADCYDESFCNGVEKCADGACVAGTPPYCGDLLCDEEYTACVECLTNADCADDVFCNGVETCLDGACVDGTAVACAQGEICDEESNSCEASSGCTDDAECDDGLFCTGAETCVAGVCVDGPGDPCEAGQDCHEGNDQCVSGEACATDADCDDNVYCNGIESCSSEASPSVCVDGSYPCEADQICDEQSESCENAIAGNLQIGKANVKAGKKADTDSIKFSGLLNASQADLNAAVGGTVIVSLTAETIPGSGVIEFTFPIEAGNIKKGKYKSPKPALKADPVTSLAIDTNKGTIKFSAKKADLTGLSCPIIVRIEIGDYSAETELDEGIVNGEKPCPPELLE